ncbi:LANO_0C07492g1_1 [Lachancea nothofagi CBS 11611]|uniref:Pre-mRNA-splicing factor CLF1 n=1 Tax=Lachancea nothofagi CBS 11611 TaxID=1266666 RepID=A0A1G4J8U7_9SACH|nr:LANO_0C07492g1_1 [Lachancea nothofagi CBS 11611]
MDAGIRQLSGQDILKEAATPKHAARHTTKVEILDLEELKDYQGRKRAEFENVLKVKRLDVKQWIRYAQFEVLQHDLRRARSIFERALQVNNSYVPLWIKYIDCELKAKNINHARNLLDRATNLLPRIDKLWLKYVIVEESLGNLPIVRALFSKWCSLEPGHNAFDAFVEFETRCGEFENVRKVYSRYVLVHPGVKTWLRWIAFEKKHGDVNSIRQVLSLGLDTLGLYESTSDSDIASIVRTFAEWEATQQESERASALYRLATEKWPNNELLVSERVRFEKMYDLSTNLDTSITEKRKMEYENILRKNSRDYETWWVYLDLLQKHYASEYEIALGNSIASNAPEDEAKTLTWRRYIYLWIRALTFFELSAGNYERTREIFETLIKDVIPNSSFTFAKIWRLYANFELRQSNLTTARKILGYALGTCPKNKIFKDYIQLEIQLKEFDRVRKLYEKFISFNPYAVSNWLAYAELEDNLGDEDRARAIFHLAVSEEIGLEHQDQVKILRELINFEISVGEYARAESVYRKLLTMSSYDASMWIDLAIFQSSVPTEEQLIQEANNDNEDEDTLEVTDIHKLNTRKVFEEALSYYKEMNDKEGRYAILKALRAYEDVHGTIETQAATKERLPVEKSKTKREGGIDVEYVDLEFPEDATGEIATDRKSKLLAMAQKWQRGKESS